MDVLVEDLEEVVEEDDEEADEEERGVDVPLGLFFETFPSTIQLPFPCSQHVVALFDPLPQHHDSSSHCSTI